MLIRIRKCLGNKNGFTLVELLVVIAILGVLAAIAIPRFANATVSANTTKLAADLANIDSAIQLYLARHPGVTTLTLNQLVADGELAYVPRPPQSGQYYAVLNNTTPIGVGAVYTLAANGTYAITTFTDATGVINLRATYGGYVSQCFHP